MAEARRREAWEHTSAMMALYATINTTRGKVYKPSDFNPYNRQQADVVLPQTDDLSILTKFGFTEVKNDGG